MKINKMNKKGLEFKLAFFALIAMSISIIAIGTWINDWNDAYDSNLSYNLDEYEQSSYLYNESGNQQDSVTITSTNTGEEFEGTSIRGVFGILNGMYSSFRVVFGEGGMLDSLEKRFRIPTFITGGISTMMIIAITFALVAIFFRLPRRSA